MQLLFLEAAPSDLLKGKTQSALQQRFKYSTLLIYYSFFLKNHSTCKIISDNLTGNRIRSPRQEETYPHKTPGS